MIGDWLLEGAERDAQSVTSDWEFAGLRLIDGVLIRNVRNVPTDDGLLTEIYRRDWGLGPIEIGQVFQRTLRVGGISGWHAHAVTTDRLFVTDGLLKIVLYDSRSGSSTQGMVNELRVGRARPALILVPPKVWHGVQNISDFPGSLVNLPDRAYEYESPDHWRLPPDTDQIPYRFSAGSGPVAKQPAR